MTSFFASISYSANRDLKNPRETLLEGPITDPFITGANLNEIGRLLHEGGLFIPDNLGRITDMAKEEAAQFTVGKQYLDSSFTNAPTLFLLRSVIYAVYLGNLDSGKRFDEVIFENEVEFINAAKFWVNNFMFPTVRKDEYAFLEGKLEEMMTKYQERSSN